MHDRAEGCTTLTGFTHPRLQENRNRARDPSYRNLVEEMRLDLLHHILVRWDYVRFEVVVFFIHYSVTQISCR